MKTINVVLLKGFLCQDFIRFGEFYEGFYEGWAHGPHTWAALKELSKHLQIS